MTSETIANPSAAHMDQPKSVHFNIFADVGMDVYRNQNGFQTVFTDSDRQICTYTSKTEFWNSPDIGRKMVAQLHNALNPEQKLDKEVLGNKFQIIFDTIREQFGTNTDARHALSSPAVQKVVPNTKSVTAIPGNPAIYSIEILNSVIQFTSDELNGHVSKLNNTWLNITLVDQLDATKEDFREIVRCWLEMAEKPADTTSIYNEVDIWKEQFITLLSMTPVSDQQTCLADGKTIWIEENQGVITPWVPACHIDNFLNELGKDQKEKISFLSELIKTGITKEDRSKTIRYSPKKGGTRRCWHVDPDYIQLDNIASTFDRASEVAS